MLVALQVDVLGRRPQLDTLTALTVDVRGEEPYPSPRHIFYGHSEEEALGVFRAHAAQDERLKLAVTRGAIDSKFKEVLWEEDSYPLVRHVFYGVMQDQTEEHLRHHANQDPYLLGKIREGSFDTSWRTIPFKDKASLAG